MWERWSTRVTVSVACMAATAVFVVVGDPEAEPWHEKLHEFVYQVCVATLPVGPARAHASPPGPGHSIASVRSNQTVTVGRSSSTRVDPTVGGRRFGEAGSMDSSPSSEA